MNWRIAAAQAGLILASFGIGEQAYKNHAKAKEFEKEAQVQLAKRDDLKEVADGKHGPEARQEALRKAYTQMGQQEGLSPDEVMKKYGIDKNKAQQKITLDNEIRGLRNEASHASKESQEAGDAVKGQAAVAVALLVAAGGLIKSKRGGRG